MIKVVLLTFDMQCFHFAATCILLLDFFIISLESYWLVFEFRKHFLSVGMYNILIISSLLLEVLYESVQQFDIRLIVS